MKKWFLLPVLVLLLALTVPAASAADMEAERTSYGMKIGTDGTLTGEGALICAVYDALGRMIGLEAVSDPADILVYCDVNQARGVKVFSLNRETLAPAAAPAETTLEAPVVPIHVHDWNEGTVTAEPGCETAGTVRFTCKASDCSETPKAVWDRTLPALGHDWGDWEMLDEASHVRACANDPAHTGTEDHGWDDGVVTTKPTADTEGVKTYTCAGCGGEKTEILPPVTSPDVWFSVTQNGTWYVNWTPVELASGEYYYVNGALKTQSSCTVDSIIGSITETSDLEITVGTYSDRRPLYTAEDAIVIEPMAAPTVAITGQSSGQYLAETTDMSDAGYTYYLTFKNPEGKVLDSSQKSAYGRFNLSPYDGCTAEVYLLGGHTVSADTTVLTLKRSGTATVNTFTYCEVPEEAAEVSTYNDLMAALKRGGTVKLAADISYNSTLMVNSGPEAVLDLNGHTLSLWNIHVSNAKVLTVLGTTEGSSVVNTQQNYYAIHGEKDAVVTVKGGTYLGHGGIRCNQNGTSSRSLTVSDVTITVDTTAATKRAIEAYACESVKLTNVTASTNSYAALNVSGCGELTVTGGSYTSTYSGTNSGCGAIVVNETPAVTLTNVTAESVQQALHVGVCDTLTVIGGSYTSTMENTSGGYAVDVFDCGEAEISGISATGLVGGLKAYRCGDVTVSDSELECTYEGDFHYDAHALYVSDVRNLTLADVNATSGNRATVMRVGTTLSVTDCTFNGTGEMPRSLEIVDWEDVTLTHITVNNGNVHSQGAVELNGCTKVILQGSEKGHSVIDHCTSNDWQDGAGLRTCNCGSVEISDTDITGRIYLEDTATILSGTFEDDPTDYVDTARSTAAENADGLWDVTRL